MSDEERAVRIWSNAYLFAVRADPLEVWLAGKMLRTVCNVGDDEKRLMFLNVVPHSASKIVPERLVVANPIFHMPTVLEERPEKILHLVEPLWIKRQ